MFIPFVKLHAHQNDFILVEHSSISAEFTKDQIIHLCHPKRGIGADGVLIVKKDASNAFSMQIFNSDGNEADMCGNALFCILRWIQEKDPHITVVTIQSKYQKHCCSILKDGYLISLHTSKIKIISDDIELFSKKVTAYQINSGVDHLVIFVNDLNTKGLMDEARRIRHLKIFSPTGVNVNFVKLFTSFEMEIRTFEKGCEYETNACGTGALACAAVSRELKKVFDPITVIFRSKEKVQISRSEQKLDEFTVLGNAYISFVGSVEIKSMEKVGTK